MKKASIIIMSMALLTSTIPAVAAEETFKHGPSHAAHDVECTKECDMLLKNCAVEVDSIHERIRKLQEEIHATGANRHTLEEIKALNKRLKEANETLRVLSKPR